MFTIDTNQAIRISRGDDSGEFRLFINKGSALKPIQKELFKPFEPVVYYTPDTFEECEVDKDVWEAKTLKIPGMYSFIYTQENDPAKEADPHWELDGERVNLIDYGISYTLYEGCELQIDDAIQIKYESQVDEVQLIVYEINKPYEHFLFKKTFKTDGTIICENKCGQAYKLKDQDIISEGDFLLSLDARDTKMLRPDEYRYIVRSKLYNPMKEKYVINTIIGEKEFYIIER